MLCISCELVNEKVTFDVICSLFEQLSGDNHTRRMRKFIGLEYSDFFIAIYFIASMRFPKEAEQQKIFNLIESVKNSLVQILENPGLLDRIVNTFTHFIVCKVFNKFVQYQKLLYEAYKQCLGSISPEQQLANSNTNNNRTPQKPQQLKSSKSKETYCSGFEKFCIKYCIVPDLTPMPIVRRVAAHVQSLFNNPDGFTAFFGCLHFLAVCLIENATIQSTSRHPNDNSSSEQHTKYTISNYSTLIQCGIERIVWQVQSRYHPNSQDVIRKPTSSTLNKRANKATASKVITSTNIPTFSSLSSTESPPLNPLVSKTVAEIIGSTTTGAILMKENENLRNELNSNRIEFEGIIEELEKTVYFQSQQLQVLKKEADAQSSFVSEHSDNSAKIVSALRRQIDVSKSENQQLRDESEAHIEDLTQRLSESIALVNKLMSDHAAETTALNKVVSDLEESLRVANEESRIMKECYESQLYRLSADFDVKTVECSLRNIGHMDRIDELTAELAHCNEQRFLREQDLQALLQVRQLVHAATMTAPDTDSGVDVAAASGYIEELVTVKTNRDAVLLCSLQLHVENLSAALEAQSNEFNEERDHWFSYEETFVQDANLQMMRCEDVTASTSVIVSRYQQEMGVLTQQLRDLKALCKQQASELLAANVDISTLNEAAALNSSFDPSDEKILEYQEEIHRIQQEYTIRYVQMNEDILCLQRDLRVSHQKVDQLEMILEDRRSHHSQTSELFSLKELQQEISRLNAALEDRDGEVYQLQEELDDLEKKSQQKATAYQAQVLQLQQELTATLNTRSSKSHRGSLIVPPVEEGITPSLNIKENKSDANRSVGGDLRRHSLVLIGDNVNALDDVDHEDNS